MIAIGAGRVDSGWGWTQLKSQSPVDGLYLSINKAAARTFNCIAGFPPPHPPHPLANLFATDHSPQIGCVSTDWILQEESLLPPPPTVPGTEYYGRWLSFYRVMRTPPPHPTPAPSHQRHRTSTPSPRPYYLLISRVNCCRIDPPAASLIQGGGGACGRGCYGVYCH